MTYDNRNIKFCWKLICKYKHLVFFIIAQLNMIRNILMPKNTEFKYIKKKQLYKDIIMIRFWILYTNYNIFKINADIILFLFFLNFIVDLLVLNFNHLT